MSRQRTKIEESRHRVRWGGAILESRDFVGSDAKRQAYDFKEQLLVKFARPDGWATVSRVTVYRLAPLVELPAWERNDEGTYYVSGGEADDAHDRAVIEVDGNEAEDCAYEASVYDAAGRLADEDNMVFESSSLENVKRWVEERLRLQGYKVAKAKKGKGS